MSLAHMEENIGDEESRELEARGKLCKLCILWRKSHLECLSLFAKLALNSIKVKWQKTGPCMVHQNFLDILVTITTLAL